MKKFIFSLILCFFSIHPNPNIKTTYNFTNSPIDIIIPCHEKDLRTLNLVIQGIKKNGKDIRKVFVISKKPLTNAAEWIPEEIFPFTKHDIAIAITHGDKTMESTVSEPGKLYIWAQYP